MNTETTNAFAFPPRANYRESLEFLKAFEPEGEWSIVAIGPDGIPSTANFNARSVQYSQIQVPGNPYSNYNQPPPQVLAPHPLIGWLEQVQKNRLNVYFGVGQPQIDQRGRLSKARLAGTRYFHVDIDLDKPGPYDWSNPTVRQERINAGFAKITAMKIQPAFVTFTGGGINALFRIHKGAKFPQDLERVEEINKALLCLTDDLDHKQDSVHDVTRILRLPGTINFPSEAKIKRGRVEIAAQLLIPSPNHPPQTLGYSLSGFDPLLKITAEKRARALPDIVPELRTGGASGDVACFYNEAEFQELKRALTFISPNDEKEWLEVCKGTRWLVTHRKWPTIPVWLLFDEWSRGTQNSNYSYDKNRYRWNSFKRVAEKEGEKLVTVNSIYALARIKGFDTAESLNIRTQAIGEKSLAKVTPAPPRPVDPQAATRKAEEDRGRAEVTETATKEYEARTALAVMHAEAFPEAVQAQGGSEQGLTWTKPDPINVPLHPVPAMDDATMERLLPLQWLPWIKDCSYRASYAPEYASAAAIVSAASLIGARCGMAMKSKDTWQVPCILWGLPVGGVSRKKSLGLKDGMRSFSGIAEKETEKHLEALKLFEAKKVTHGEMVKEIKAQLANRIKRNMKGDKPADAPSFDTRTLAQSPDMPGTERSIEFLEKLLATANESTKKPVPRRLDTNDATIEKLGMLLSQNEGGLLVWRDEIMGLLATFDREGHQNDRSKFLELWDAGFSHKIDRQNEDVSIDVKKMAACVLGAIQPEKLLAFMQFTAKTNSEDGLQQRFQIMVYPDGVPNIYRDETPNFAAQEMYDRTFERLAEFDWQRWRAFPPRAGMKLPYYRFDAQAQARFRQWHDEFNSRAEKEPNTALQSHLLKYDRVIGALSLLFHLIEIAETMPKLSHLAANTPQPTTEEIIRGDTAIRPPVMSWQAAESCGYVKLSSLQKAIAWTEFLEEHARRCYGLLADSGLRAAQALAEGMKNEKREDGTWILKNGFTARDVQERNWKYLTEKKIIDEALEWLVEKNWIQGIPKGKTIRYYINPAVREIGPGL